MKNRDKSKTITRCRKYYVIIACIKTVSTLHNLLTLKLLLNLVKNKVFILYCFLTYVKEYVEEYSHIFYLY